MKNLNIKNRYLSQSSDFLSCFGLKSTISEETTETEIIRVTMPMMIGKLLINF